MKKIVCQIICVIMVIVLTSALLWKTSEFFEYKQSRAKCDEFFASSQDYDIWFFGTSHAVMGYLPMELWDEYRMTSYSFSNYGQWIPVDYWLLRLALQYQTPKLVVIDTYDFASNDKYSEGHLSYLHEEFDAFPYSPLKKEAIEDLFPEERVGDYLNPFSVYHSQWNQITQKNFQSAEELYTYGKGSDESGLIGAASGILVKPQVALGPVEIQDHNDIDSVGKDYLIKVIELCKEKDIDVLLTTIPYVSDAEQIKTNNAIYEIANEYGVLFYNGMTEDIIDVKTDFWDSGHLNSSGARKWSSSLGEFISKNYNIQEHTESCIFEKWNSDYKDIYMNYKISIASNRNSMEDYLMLIADKHLSACIFMSEASGYDNSDELIALLENLSNRELIGLKRSIQDGGNYLLIISKSDDAIKEVNSGQAYQNEFDFGNLCYDNNSLTINESDNYLIETYDDGTVPYMQIVLVNDITNQVVDVSRFVLADGNQQTLRK